MNAEEIVWHQHHFLPKRLGGTDDPENIYKVNIAMHAFLHEWLYHEYGDPIDKAASNRLRGLIPRATEILAENKKSSSQRSRKMVENGTHPFLGGKVVSRTNAKRLDDGTHLFLSGEFKTKNNLKRVANGTHHLLGGEIQKRSNAKRIAEGTHNFLGGKLHKRLIAEGTHQSVRRVECPHCGKVGSYMNMKRWHFDKCKSKP